VVLAAETGSGKTLAYLAPVVEAVLRRRAAEGVVHGEDAAPSSDEAALSSVAVGREWPTAQVPPERCGPSGEVVHWTAHRAQGYRQSQRIEDGRSSCQLTDHAADTVQA
jgi:hypothetical protein